MSVGTSPKYTFKWNFGDGDTVSGQYVKHHFAKPGFYTVKADIYADGAFDTTLSKKIIVTGLSASFISAGEGCQFKFMQFGDSSVVQNTKIVKWLWRFGDRGTSTSQNPTHEFVDTGKFTVTLILTTTSGCSDSVKRTVHIGSGIATIDFTVPATICAKSTAIFGPMVNIFYSAFQGSYFWKFSDGTTTTDAEPWKIFDKGGSYTVTLIATSKTGCKDSITKKVYVSGMALGFTALNHCFDSSVNFVNTSSAPDGIKSYRWRFGDLGSSTVNNPTHKYLEPGTYKVWLTAFGKNGCVDSISQNVTVYPKPVINNLISFYYCTPVPWTIQETGHYDAKAIAPDSIVQYLWRFNDGSTYHTDTVKKTVTSYGRVTLWLTVVTKEGCRDSASAFYNTTKPPTASFKTTFERNQKVIFTSTSHDSLWNIRSTQWYFYDANGGSDTGKIVTHVYPKPGYYYLSLDVSNGYPCYGYSYQKIYVPPTPVANFTAASSICRGDTLVLANQSRNVDTLSHIFVNWGDDKTYYKYKPDIKQVHHVYATAGNFTITFVAAIDSSLCCDTMRQAILVNAPHPVITQSVDTLISSAAASYQWYDSSGKIAGATYQKYQVKTEGKYYVEAVNSSGCHGTSDVYFATLKDSLIGQVFSSGNQALNNAWIYLIKLNRSDTNFEKIDSQLTSSAGTFAFHVSRDSFYLKAFPDTVLNSNEIPGWHDSALYFLKASPLIIKKRITPANVYTKAGKSSGIIGNIGGKVYACTSCKQDEPVAGVQIVLLKDNLPVHYTLTNKNGEFYFSGLDTGKYTFISDGPKMKNLNPPAINLNIDTGVVNAILTLYPDHLELANPSSIRMVNNTIGITVFPNPFSDGFSIRINLPRQEKIGFVISDISGKSIFKADASEYPGGESFVSFSPSILKKGIYFLRIFSADEVITKRIEKL
jgi:PKD repeat protein